MNKGGPQPAWTAAAQGLHCPRTCLTSPCSHVLAVLQPRTTLVAQFGGDEGGQLHRESHKSTGQGVVFCSYKSTYEIAHQQSRRAEVWLLKNQIQHGQDTVRTSALGHLGASCQAMLRHMILTLNHRKSCALLRQAESHLESLRWSPQ